MGTSQTLNLQELFNAIRHDVMFDHISSEVLEKEIINGQEYQKIKAQSTNHEQISIFLDIISKKDPNVYQKLATIFEKDYHWLSEALKKSCSKVKTDKSPKISHLSKGITDEMIKIVQRNVRLADKWTTLAHSLSLTRYVMDIRIKVNTFAEPNSMCVSYLLEEWKGKYSQEATLGNLLKILREYEFNDVADELEEKFT